ncbi:hypothetical protein ACN93_15455 [Gordonia paraffinivorans]|nr:hypothetical protein ACN93_15455 [Gordonia paraffinivorans]
MSASSPAARRPDKGPRPPPRERPTPPRRPGFEEPRASRPGRRPPPEHRPQSTQKPPRSPACAHRIT